MNHNYLQDKTLDNLSIEQLPAFMSNNRLQRQYTSEDMVHTFDILSDKWKLSHKYTLDIGFMRELNISMQTYLALRVALANIAEVRKASTVRNIATVLRHIGDGWQKSKDFQKTFHQLSDDQKNRLKTFLTHIAEDEITENAILKTYFEEIIEFISSRDYVLAESLKGIFDPEIGVYTDEEENEIQEKLRIRTGDVLRSLSKNNSIKPYELNRLGDVISLILMKSIHRRPIQLSWIKWSDLLPVGVSFKDHRYGNQSSTPEVERDFTDVERLHLRTFKAKRGYSFRECAEVRSHRLEPEFSRLIAIYKHYFKACLENHLGQQGIVLSEEEEEDIISRCPLFPDTNLFRTQYKNKKNMFASVGHQSPAMHRCNKVMTFRLREESKELQLTSSRLQQFNLSNNRNRHTVITRAIELNYSSDQVAAITGVSVESIAAYMNLDVSGRCEIDDSMARVKVLNQFAALSVDELKLLEGFVVKNEFDETQGAIEKTNICHTCLSNNCKPLGCYGCANFRPFIEADHHENLRRIEDKIAFNQGAADPQVLKKLNTSRLYVKSVIALVQEIRISKRGLAHAD